jgi:isocitrate dehydrogenase
VEATISSKRVTYDLERQLEGAEKLATSEFAEAIVENIERLAERVFRPPTAQP